ncbi:hypothetical protein ACFU7U_00850 [Streptomyces celluloflavus]|uniref:hypothetical protein n=1 Tax=Streptomyces celluloflavus TaxID=58344 RepID=UPI0036A31CDE
MLSVVNADGSTSNASLMDEFVREGARRLLAAALEAEVDACIAELADQRDLVALVRAGARFERGHLVERPEAVAA